MSTALFKISTSTAGYVNINTLMPIAKEPDWSYAQYSREDILGDGTVRGSGYPISEWHFGYLTHSEFAALKEFCPGKSASVYMVTKTHENTYGTYTAVMVWPENVRWQNSKAIDVTVKFQKMEAV